MIDFKTAKEIAEQELQKIGNEAQKELRVVDNLEFKYGWVFFYQTKEFVETGDLNLLLGGNSPIIVDKHNSSVHLVGTGIGIEEYVDQYCLHRDKI